MNKIAVTGRLSKDPTVRYTPSGKVVCQFTLAVQREFKNADGQYEADFIPVVLWSNSAEVAGNNLSKGKKILVEGRLQTRSYVDKQNVTRWVTELVGILNICTAILPRSKNLMKNLKILSRAFLCRIWIISRFKAGFYG